MINNNYKNLLRVAFVIYIFLIIFYLLWFGYKLNLPVSQDSSSWGQFGDFVGGIANPLFSLFALFALIRTLELSSEGLSQSEKNNLSIMYENAVIEMEKNYEKLLTEHKEFKNSIGTTSYTLTEIDRKYNNIAQRIFNTLDAIRIVIEKANSLGLILPYADYFVWSNAAIPLTLKKEYKIITNEDTIKFYENRKETFYSVESVDTSDLKKSENL